MSPEQIVQYGNHQFYLGMFLGGFIVLVIALEIAAYIKHKK